MPTKKSPYISVIVPAYNAENTLVRCLDSILGQTYEDFELIIIDDGSKDKTKEIIDKYAREDSRVIPIHKENGGVSSARNAGLEIARGEYVAFIDSDDWIKPGYFCNATGTDFDLVITSYKTFGQPIAVTPIQESELHSVDQIRALIDDEFGKLILRVPWGKFFKKSIICDNYIRFDQNMRLGEDTAFVLDFLSYCKNVKINQNPGYQYFTQKDRMHQYKLNGEEYLYCISLLTSKLRNGGGKKAITSIKEIFRSIFETGLWHNGIESAKINSRDWIRLRLWRYLPETSVLYRIRYSIKMLLWPYIYKDLIKRNER